MSINDSYRRPCVVLERIGRLGRRFWTTVTPTVVVAAALVNPIVPALPSKRKQRRMFHCLNVYEPAIEEANKGAKHLQLDGASVVEVLPTQKIRQHSLGASALPSSASSVVLSCPRTSRRFPESPSRRRACRSGRGAR